MPLSVVLESEVLSVLMDGKVNLNPADIMKSLTLAGKFNFSAPSLKNLAQHLSEGASPMPDEKLSLQTLKARITPKSFAAQAATLNMGDKEAIGSFELAWGGKRPSLTGDFTLNEINWPLAVQTSSVTEEQKETQTPAKGWDAAPMDFSGLRKMDMAVNLNVAEVVTPNLTLKDVAARVSLKAGKLGATITKASLLEGQGTGQLMLDASAAMPEWQLALQGKGLDAISVQKLMLPETKVTGVVAADIQIASRGHSQQQWMDNLYGQGNLTLKEGVVQGYHLPALFSNLKAEAARESSDTKDAEAAITFTAEGGVATLRESELKGRGVAAALSGTVDMGKRYLNLLLRPKMQAQYDAENVEQQKSAGLLILVRVRGSFENISVLPDASAALKEALTNPEQAKQNIEILKKEGDAIWRQVKDRKKTIDAEWKDLKKNKNPDALGNILNQLDDSGVAMPKILDVFKTPKKDTAGSVDAGAGAGGESDTGAVIDSGGEGAGQQGQPADESRPADLPAP
jgi:AsmA protein